MKVKIHIVYSFDGKWWGTEALGFPGAFGQGKTRGEAKKSIISAIRELTISYREQGQTPPWEKVDVKSAEVTL